MKTIKILLVVATITILGVCILIWWDSIVEPPRPPKPQNQFTERIEREIDSLKKSPANMSCQKFYKDIQYRIDDYHKQKYLDANDNDNNQWKENLSIKLYSAYADKFAKYAMRVFNGSEWKNDELKFINNELKTLKSSSYLKPGPIATEFKNIDNILNKYYEIVGFISACNKFSYSNYEIKISPPNVSDENYFPDVSDKIKKAQDYLTNNLGNNYVKNCVHLKNGLEAIPQNLFNKHIDYLKTKIEQNGTKYEDYDYQSDYNRLIYRPLKTQVEDLNNNTYGIDINTFDREYNSLDQLLGFYNKQAVDYFRRR